MSFWTGKHESLLQSFVEITFKSVLSGVVIVVFAQVLIGMVDARIEVASKRDALNSFRNDQLTKLTTQLSEAYLKAGCTRSLRTANSDACRSALSAFVTDLDAIFWELKAHYPDQGFDRLIALKAQGEGLHAAGAPVTQDSLNTFAAAFGDALNEMAQNFR